MHSERTETPVGSGYRALAMSCHLTIQSRQPCHFVDKLSNLPQLTQAGYAELLNAQQSWASWCGDQTIKVAEIRTDVDGGLFPSSLWFPSSPKDSSKGAPGQEMEEGRPDRAGQLQAIDFERDQMKEAS